MYPPSFPEVSAYLGQLGASDTPIRKGNSAISEASEYKRAGCKSPKTIFLEQVLFPGSFISDMSLISKIYKEY